MSLQVDTVSTARLSRSRTISPPLVTLTLIHGESLAILAGSFLAGFLYHGVAYHMAPDGYPAVGFGAAFAALFALLSFFRDDYRAALTQDRRQLGRNLVQTFTFTYVAVIILGFLTKTSDIYSRGNVLFFYPVSLALLYGARVGVIGTIRRATALGLLSAGRVMVVGLQDEVSAFLKRGNLDRHGYNLARVERIWPTDLADADAFARRVDGIVDLARQAQPDVVVLALPWSDEARIDQCLRALMNLPVRVELATERVLDRFKAPRIARLGPVMTLNVLRPPLGHTGRAAKRLFDISAALLALVLLSPVLLAVALLIRLDSAGPVLFRQTRYGFNQEPFRIWKFRSMRVMDDGPVVRQAARDDVRITRIGRFIRKWNIDELPQLINVLVGDMSLVGPRPHAVAHNRQYEGRIDLYARRHNVRPGITGWAQVHGLRGATDDEAMHKRVEYDLYYLDNWSFSLDVAILFMTVFGRASYRNAY